MRAKNSLLTAAVIGLAVVAGLLGVGGTWALWNDSAPSDAGTVRAATFEITVNGTSVPADGAEVSVKLEDPSARLTPSTPVYAAVEVEHTTNASAPFTVDATLGTPTAESAPSALADHLLLRTAPQSAGTCADVTYSPGLPPSGQSARIEKNSSATFCLEVSLASSAPASLSGTTATIELPLYIEQIPAGA